MVQIGGPAYAIDTARLEEAKAQSAPLRDLLSRYADALLAQMMQSIACNALHSAEARCSRWLLATQDRVERSPIPLTQESLAEMLGVQRTTVTAVVKELQGRGLIHYTRGRVEIVDRDALERSACECYASVEKHFIRLMPAVAASRAH
jgi:CRP-like cAMP-binding protein